MKKFLKRAYSLPAIIVFAFVLMVLNIKLQPGIERNDQTAIAKVVEYVEVRKIAHRARALAYGEVAPTTFLQANAEVAGKIVYVHPHLKQGATLAAGTRVLQIDRTNYDLALAQARADLAVSRANLEELKVSEENLRISLAIAERSLILGKAELKRKKKLLTQNAISQSAVDTEEQRVLNLKLEVQQLNSQLALLPSRYEVARAQIVRGDALVAEKKRNLERTEIYLPFNARIGDVYVEEEEFAASGSRLFNALDMAQVEIKAHLPMIHARPLVLGLALTQKAAAEEKLISLATTELSTTPLAEQQSSNPLSQASLQSSLQPAVQPSLTSVSQPSKTPLSKQLGQQSIESHRWTQSLVDELGLDVSVRLIGAAIDARWEATLVRVGEAVDTASRTLSFVVAIDNPYEQMIPGKRPPLLKGIYTEVEFLAPPVERLVIPRRAIHNGLVYRISSDNTLDIQPVEVDFYQGELAIIESGLQYGDRIVINDLAPAVAGTHLNPIHKPSLQEEITALSLGKGVFK